jgi:hypothetical protein
MAKSEGKVQQFNPHANVPGPARLEMERADNSGTVNADPMFIADRQAIINHVMAYAYLVDESRWDNALVMALSGLGEGRRPGT